MKGLLFLSVFGVAFLAVSGQSCNPDEYQCSDGECVPGDWECDGWSDCRGGEDEVGCPCEEDGNFLCEDGYCIPPNWICDGDRDCLGGEDERNCSCKVGERYCDDGFCVSEEYWCDGEGIWDCEDGSDEANCDNQNQTLTHETSLKHVEIEKKTHHRMGLAKLTKLYQQGEISQARYEKTLKLH